MNIYGVCDNGCKYLVFTREEVLSLLQQAINDGSLKNIDVEYAAISKIVCGNGGEAVKFWTGTEAEFNALSPAPDIDYFIPRRGKDGTIYICVDDTHIGGLPSEPLSNEQIITICG